MKVRRSGLGNHSSDSLGVFISWNWFLSYRIQTLSWSPHNLHHSKLTHHDCIAEDKTPCSFWLSGEEVFLLETWTFPVAVVRWACTLPSRSATLVEREATFVPTTLWAVIKWMTSCRSVQKSPANFPGSSGSERLGARDLCRKSILFFKAVSLLIMPLIVTSSFSP